LPEIENETKNQISKEQNINLSYTYTNIPMMPDKKDRSTSTSELDKYMSHTGEEIKENFGKNLDITSKKISDTYVKLTNIRLSNSDLNPNKTNSNKNPKQSKETKEITGLKSKKNKNITKQNKKGWDNKKLMNSISKGLSLKEAIARVCEWRSLCYLTKKGKGKIQMTKEMAAHKIGMKKKSLDDYLMFLRLGIAMKYDFASNLNSSFHSLRQIIKKTKPRPHWKKGICKDVDFLGEL